MARLSLTDCVAITPTAIVRVRETSYAAATILWLYIDVIPGVYRQVAENPYGIRQRRRQALVGTLRDRTGTQ